MRVRALELDSLLVKPTSATHLALGKQLDPSLHWPWPNLYQLWGFGSLPTLSMTPVLHLWSVGNMNPGLHGSVRQCAHEDTASCLYLMTASPCPQTWAPEACFHSMSFPALLLMVSKDYNVWSGVKRQAILIYKFYVSLIKSFHWKELGGTILNSDLVLLTVVMVSMTLYMWWPYCEILNK